MQKAAVWDCSLIEWYKGRSSTSSLDGLLLQFRTLTKQTKCQIKQYNSAIVYRQIIYLFTTIYFSLKVCSVMWKVNITCDNSWTRDIFTVRLLKLAQSDTGELSSSAENRVLGYYPKLTVHRWSDLRLRLYRVAGITRTLVCRRRRLNRERPEMRRQSCDYSEGMSASSKPNRPSETF